MQVAVTNGSSVQEKLRMRRLHHRVRERVNEETTNENDDLLEEIYMMIYVKMINGKTISIKCEGKQTAAIISDEVERRSLIPRDMTYLVHRKSDDWKENNRGKQR